MVIWNLEVTNCSNDPFGMVKKHTYWNCQNMNEIRTLRSKALWLPLDLLFNYISRNKTERFSMIKQTEALDCK